MVTDRKRTTSPSPAARLVIVTGVMALCLALAGFGCQGAPGSADLKEIRDGQKQILERLDKLIAAQRPAPRPGPQIDYNKVYDIELGSSPVRGDKDAKVTLVEFSDFQCPYSQRAQPLIQQLLDAFPQGFRHVYKNFPLQFHNRAKPAALACLAAGKQGKFWEMHKLLFENPRNLEDADLKTYAQKVGLDLAQFEEDLKSEQIEKLIQEDLDQVRKATVTGTPTLFLNGKRVQDRSPEAMKKDIETLLQAKPPG